MAEIVVEGASGFAMYNKDVYIPIIIKISRQHFSRDTLSGVWTICIGHYKCLISDVGESFITVIPKHRSTVCEEIQIAVVVKINRVEWTRFRTCLLIFDEGRSSPTPGGIYSENPYPVERLQ